MINLLKIVLGSILIVAVVLGVSFMSLEGAGAASPKQEACQGSGGTWNPQPTAADPQAGTCTTPGSNRTVAGTLQQVSNILIFVVGGVSVIMAIIGAMRYALAQGDSNAVNAAKNTIIYAIIGLILAFAAFGIVNFVASQFQ